VSFLIIGVTKWSCFSAEIAATGIESLKIEVFRPEDVTGTNSA